MTRRTAAKESTEQVEQAPAGEDAPAAPAALDLSALAEGATEAPELPRATRRADEGTMALSRLVDQSYRNGKPYELPAVALNGSGPEKVTAALISAVRRAASIAELGVSVRSAVTDDGVVITLLGKEKQQRLAQPDNIAEF